MKDLQNLKLVVKITRMGAAVLSTSLMFQEIMMLTSPMGESTFLVRAPSQWLSEEGRSQTMDSEFLVGCISLVLWDVDVLLAFCFSSEFRQKRQWHLARWVQMSGTGKETLTLDSWCYIQVVCNTSGHKNSLLICGCNKDPVLQ